MTGDTLRQRIDELERALKANEEAWQKRRAELSAEPWRNSLNTSCPGC